jgi:hypothetical protein
VTKLARRSSNLASIYFLCDAEYQTKDLVRARQASTYLWGIYIYTAPNFKQCGFVLFGLVWFYWDRVSTWLAWSSLCSPGWPLTLHLPALPHECWDYRLALPHLTVNNVTLKAPLLLSNHHSSCKKKLAPLTWGFFHLMEFKT